MHNRSAIHFKLIVVSCRSRRAARTFPEFPLRRTGKSVSSQPKLTLDRQWALLLEEFSQVHLPGDAGRAVEAHPNPEEVVVHHLHGVTWEIVKEERPALHPRLSFRHVNGHVMGSPRRPQGDAFDRPSLGIPRNAFQFEGALQDMAVGREHLGDISFLVQRQEDHAGRRNPDPQFARELAMQTFVPEVVGQIGLRRIEP